MAEERTYVIPLRGYWRLAPRYKRAKRAINGVRHFVIRHMKVDEVKIGKELNDLILERGQRKPPARVQVTIVKDGSVGKVNVAGIPYSKEAPKEEKKSSLKKTAEKEAKPAEKKEEKPEHKHDGHDHSHEVPEAAEVKAKKPVKKTKTIKKSEEKKE